MAATTIALVGGPAPYREALTAKLETSGFEVADGGNGALVICCTDQSHWDQASDAALWTPTVVVIPNLDLDAFVRALALGAGAVHLDTPTEIMVDVVAAAISGEALIPLAITQALASHVPPTTKQVAEAKLEGVELQIVEGLVDGLTIGQIAAALSYSDRTVRRKLQGIYLKLGVADRAAAIKALRSRSM